MKYKVAELEGALLDAAVAIADGGRLDPHRPSSEMQIILATGGLKLAGPQPKQLSHHQWSPSTDWNQGGPIIDRELIEWEVGDAPGPGYIWYAKLSPFNEPFSDFQRGPTPLIASMRAYVASKFGEELELP